MLPAPPKRLMLIHDRSVPRRFRRATWVGSWCARPSDEAQRFTSAIYRAWLEQAIAQGKIEMPFIL